MQIIVREIEAGPTDKDPQIVIATFPDMKGYKDKPVMISGPGHYDQHANVIRVNLLGNSLVIPLQGEVDYMFIRRG